MRGRRLCGVVHAKLATTGLLLRVAPRVAPRSTTRLPYSAHTALTCDAPLILSTAPRVLSASAWKTSMATVNAFPSPMTRYALTCGARWGGSVTRRQRRAGKSPGHGKSKPSSVAPPVPDRDSAERHRTTSGNSKDRVVPDAVMEEEQDEEDLLANADEEDAEDITGSSSGTPLLDADAYEWQNARRHVNSEDEPTDALGEEDTVDEDTLDAATSTSGRGRRRRKTTVEDASEEDVSADLTHADGTTAAVANPESKALVDAEPALAAEYVAAGKVNKLPVESLQITSGAVVNWRCGKCHENWKSAVFIRCALRNGCPRCEAKKHPSIAQVRPDLVPLWHPSLNDPLDDPTALAADSRKYAFWICSECREEFRARVKDRVKDKVLCPMCPSRKHEARVDKDGTRQARQSVLAQEWHPVKNGDLRLDTLRGSQRQQTKVWWLCSQCSHTWMASVAARLSPHKRAKGATCPHCHGTPSAQTGTKASLVNVHV